MSFWRPFVPPDAAWASDASDQRIFILRRHRLTVAVSNETDHPMDLLALNDVIATAITAWAQPLPSQRSSEISDGDCQ